MKTKQPCKKLRKQYSRRCIQNSWKEKALDLLKKFPVFKLHFDRSQARKTVQIFIIVLPYMVQLMFWKHHTHRISCTAHTDSNSVFTLKFCLLFTLWRFYDGGTCYYSHHFSISHFCELGIRVATVKWKFNKHQN